MNKFVKIVILNNIVGMALIFVFWILIVLKLINSNSGLAVIGEAESLFYLFSLLYILIYFSYLYLIYKKCKLTNCGKKYLFFSVMHWLIFLIYICYVYIQDYLSILKYLSKK